MNSVLEDSIFPTTIGIFLTKVPLKSRYLKLIRVYVNSRVTLLKTINSSISIFANYTEQRSVGLCARLCCGRRRRCTDKGGAAA
jgi:hypothetical protein